MFALLSLLIFRFSMVSRAEEPKLKGKSITSGALPRPGYTYKTVVPDKNWLLRSLASTAEYVMLMVTRDPPYDVLKDVIKSNAKGCQDCRHTSDKLLNYEIPFLLFGGLSMLFAISLPLTAVTVFCCRRQGRCGGRLIEEDMDFCPTKKRYSLSIAITSCIMLIVFGNICTTVARERLNTSLPIIRETLQDSISDVIGYNSNTLTELEQVTGQDLEFTISLILGEFDGILNKATKPVMTKARHKSAPLVAAMLDLSDVLTETLESLENVNATVGELITLGTSLDVELQMLRDNLTKARDMCVKSNSTQKARLCDRIPSGKSVNTVADFKKVPNVSKILRKIKDALKVDISKETLQGNLTFEATTDTITENTEEGRKEFKDFMLETKGLSRHLLTSLSRRMNKFVETDALPFMDNVYSYFSEESSLQKYVQISSGVLIFMVLLSLVTLLLMIFGMVCGRIGTFDSELPSTRSRLSDFGGRLLMASSYSLLGISFFLHSMLAVSWVLGANGAVLCKAALDMTLIEQTIDDKSTLGYNPVSKALLKDGSFEIKLVDILRNCASGQTLWQAINLDQKVKLQNLTIKKENIPRFDELFVPMSETIKETTVLTTDSKECLDKFTSSGVGNIQPAEFTQQTELPLVNVNLKEYAGNLSKVSEESLKVNGKNLTKQLKVIVNRLLAVADDIVETERSLANILIEKATEVKRRAAQALSSIRLVLRLHEELESYLDGDGVATAEQVARKSLDQIEEWMDDYLESSIYKVRTKYGKCSPLAAIYRAFVGSVCWFLIDSTTALWLSLLITAFSSMLSIILCACLAHLYRRALENCSGKLTPISFTIPIFSDDTPLSTPGSESDSLDSDQTTPVMDDVPTGKFTDDAPPVKVALPLLQHKSPSLKTPKQTK